MNLLNPLEIKKGQLARTDDLKSSIDQAIELLLHTPVGSVAAEPEYGFELTGLMFENFDENQGTVFDSNPEKEDPVYKLKLSGSSKNIQTFAASLNDSIRRFEPRLSDVSTVMTYMRQQRDIIVAIRATMVKTKAPYEYKSIIRVWR